MTELFCTTLVHIAACIILQTVYAGKIKTTLVIVLVLAICTLQCPDLILARFKQILTLNIRGKFYYIHNHVLPIRDIVPGANVSIIMLRFHNTY